VAQVSNEVLAVQGDRETSVLALRRLRKGLGGSEMGKAVTCHDRAHEWVHTYAAGGAVLATIPLPPGGNTITLGLAETHMIYWLAKIYGEDLSVKEIAVVAGGLELAGLGLKAAAMEAANLIPIAGWIVKGAIAASAIEGIGFAITRHFEQKYPGKLYAANPDVEGSIKKDK
jgi:uncharacterized protein (DUF697 family)